MYNPYAVGAHLYLRHPTLSDAEGAWHEWLSDEETTRWLGLRHWPNSIERQRNFYASCTKGEDRLVLSIVDMQTDKHIGVCNLNGISWVHRYCDIAVVIGDAEYRKGPYVVEAFSLLLRIAFLRLNMRLVKSSFASAIFLSTSLKSLINCGPHLRNSSNVCALFCSISR